MDAADFPQANMQSDLVDELPDDEMQVVPIHRDGDTKVYTVCFKPTAAELEDIKVSGRIWVQALISGGSFAIRVDAWDPFKSREPVSRGGSQN